MAVELTYLLNATANPSRIGKIVVKKILRAIKQPVELQNRLSGSLPRIFLRHTPAPQNIVGNEQAALTSRGAISRSTRG